MIMFFKIGTIDFLNSDLVIWIQNFSDDYNFSFVFLEVLADTTVGTSLIVGQVLFVSVQIKGWIFLLHIPFICRTVLSAHITNYAVFFAIFHIFGHIFIFLNFATFDVTAIGVDLFLRNRRQVEVGSVGPLWILIDISVKLRTVLLLPPCRVGVFGLVVLRDGS